MFRLLSAEVEDLMKKVETWDAFDGMDLFCCCDPRSVVAFDDGVNEILLTYREELDGVESLVIGDIEIIDEELFGVDSK